MSGRRVIGGWVLDGSVVVRAADSLSFQIYVV